MGNVLFIPFEWKILLLLGMEDSFLGTMGKVSYHADFTGKQLGKKVRPLVFVAVA